MVQHLYRPNTLDTGCRPSIVCLPAAACDLCLRQNIAIPAEQKDRSTRAA